jgi:cytolysin (calcineurin-like family phosphatase)
MSDISLKLDNVDPNFNLMKVIPSEDYANIIFQSKNFTAENTITATGLTVSSAYLALVDDITIQFNVALLKQLSKKTYDRLVNPTTTGGINLGTMTRVNSIEGIVKYNATIQKALNSTTQDQRSGSATFKFQPL